MNRRYLVLVERPPAVGTLAREALDLLLVAGAFDLAPAVLFLGRGVHQLAASHDSAPPRPLEALATYGITRIYVDAQSLRREGLALDALAPRPIAVDGAAIARLIAESDVVLTT